MLLPEMQRAAYDSKSIAAAKKNQKTGGMAGWQFQQSLELETAYSTKEKAAGSLENGDMKAALSHQIADMENNFFQYMQATMLSGLKEQEDKESEDLLIDSLLAYVDQMNMDRKDPRYGKNTMFDIGDSLVTLVNSMDEEEFRGGNIPREIQMLLYCFKDKAMADLYETENKEKEKLDDADKKSAVEFTAEKKPDKDSPAASLIHNEWINPERERNKLF